MDLLVKDDSPSQISDKIKDMLYAKSAEKVQERQPTVANSLFGDQQSADEVDAEVEKASAVINGDDPTAVEYNTDLQPEAEVDPESESEE